MRIAGLRTAVRLPRYTVRLRLTLLYGALFLISGIVLLTTTYLLAQGKLLGGPTVFERIDIEGPGVANSGDIPPGPITREGPDPAQLGQLLVLTAVVLAVTLAVSIALGWLMAGRALRPLRTITATTQRISEESLHRRLAVTGPDDELKELADTIDGLLTRLDAAFDAQRRFAANASHELRRPLTLQRAALEIALADPAATPQSLRATCERALAATKQQEGLVDALLTLARGQRGLDALEPFDLTAVTEEVLLAHATEIRRRRLRVDTALNPASAIGDPRLAERLVLNLLDNAVRHNLPGGRVTLTTGTRAGHTVLSVANSGPVVPAAEVHRLLRPFQRLGTDRTDHTDGHGLGLSIVAAIAAIHDARLQVSAHPAGGLAVEVHFPAPLRANRT